MGTGDVLKFAFHAVRRYPKTLLPAVLSWIPVTAAVLLTALALSELSLAGLLQSAGSPQALLQLLAVLGPSLLFLAILFLVSGAFLQAFYVDVTSQFAKHKKPDISSAFYVAKRNLLPVLWVQAIIGILIFAVVAAVVIVSVVFRGILASTADNLAFLASLFAVLYVQTKTWMAVTSVVLEKKRGWSAVKRSFALSKGRFAEILFIILTISIATSIVNTVFDTIPFAGAVLTLLASLFFTVWTYTAPAAFYFEYRLGKKSIK
ncbi:MAG: hypothetical protein HY366_01700 [Candidatus Aenigmarchaeota archaeon]|nr:hypothetical protein [Candidatus Aenigmarchaeota archaeon]